VIPRFSSYRDPRAWVESDDEVLSRHFDAEGAASFQAAHDSGVLTGLSSDGLIPDYEIISADPLVVNVKPISFISYPGEWTSEMLRDAGLLTLEVAKRLWSAGFHLRDASAYNIVFDGAAPVFVDLGSVGVGHTPNWAAYGQFCDHFLNPLLIESRTGISFRKLWTLEGVPVDTAASILHGRHRWGRGVLSHVTIRNRLESQHGSDNVSERLAVRRELQLPASSVAALMDKVGRLVSRIQLGSETTWSGYEEANSYTPETASARDEAIADFAKTSPGSMRAIDIGANIGRHSAVLADYFQQVISVDFDEGAVARHRQGLDLELGRRVFPIVADLAAPTPAVGLMNQERSSLLERIEGSDAAIWMAVIHHLALSRSVPLSALAELAARIAPRHLIEFVEPEDPMAELLSASRSGEHHVYSIGEFEKAFGEGFTVHRLGNSQPHRVLYEVIAE